MVERFRRPGVLFLASFILLAVSCRKPEQPAPSSQPDRPAPPKPVAMATTSSVPASAVTGAVARVPAAPAQAPAPNAEPDPRVRLRIEWPQGARYVYRFELEQHSTNTLAQAPKSTQEDLAMGITYAVTGQELTADSLRELKLDFLAYDVEIKVGGQTVMNFDSAPGVKAAPFRSASEPFSRIAGTALGVVLQPDGSVQRLVGFDVWMKRVGGDGAEPAEQFLLQQFNEGFFRQLVDFGRGLSTNTVKVGETWPYHTEVPAGALGKLTLDSKVVFEGWETHDDRRLAVVEAHGTIQGEGQPENPGPGAIWFERGSVVSGSWIEPESASLVESTSAQQMRLGGRTANPVRGQGGGGAFTSEIAQRVTVKLVETEPKKN